MLFFYQIPPKIIYFCIIIAYYLIVVRTLPLDVNVRSVKTLEKGGNGTSSIESTITSKLGITDFIQARNFVKTPVKGEKNIFFLETSCFVSSARYNRFGGQLVLTQMSLCAIESAAMTNPDTWVYLLYTCPLDVGSIGRADALTAAPFSHPNVHVWIESVASVVRGSPVETLLASGRVHASRWPVHDASDLLRLVVLWKYGGIYLDLDFIVTKRLETAVPANFVALNCPAEDVNNAALGFASTGAGHAFVGRCLVEMADTYDGQRAYAFNGPVLLQRVLERRCDLHSRDRSTPLGDAADAAVRQCLGVAVLPRAAFYPLCFTETRGYYEPRGPCADVSLELRAAVALHLFHTSTGEHAWAALRKGSGQPIDCLQRDFCPRVYDRTPEPWPEPSPTVETSGTWERSSAGA